MRRDANLKGAHVNEMEVISGAQRSAARVAGLAFPISFAFLAYANFGIRGPLVDTDDGAETVRIIAEAVPLFRLSVAFDLLYCTGLIVLLTALYVVLSPVNRYLALLASVSKLVYAVTAILMALSFLTAVHLASDPAYVESLGPGSLYAMITLNAAASWDQYYVGLAFWALSSTLFGWLWLKSRYIPAALALLGVLASAWCLFCTVAYLVSPAFGNTVNLWLFDTPMALSHLALSTWILFRGLRDTATPVV